MGNTDTHKTAPDGKSRRTTPVRNCLRLLGLIHRASPGRIAYAIFDRCYSLGFGAFYTLMFLRTIVNAAESGGELAPVLWTIAVFALFGLFDAMQKGYYRNVFVPKSDRRVNEYLYKILTEKAVASDLACYENPEFFDGYTRAAERIGKDAQEVVSTAGNVAGLSFALAINGGFIFAVDIMMLALCAAPTALIFFCESRRAKAFAEGENAGANSRRSMDYVKRTVYRREFAKEQRLSGIFGVLKRRYDRAAAERLRLAGKYGARVAVWRFIGEAAIWFGLQFGLYAFAAWRYLEFFAFALGDFVSLSGGIINLVFFVEDLAYYAQEIAKTGATVGNFFAFADAEPKIASGTREFSLARELRFEDVRFTYPGQTAPVLDGMSFSVERGKVCALAGINGAGKSTIIKLLFRFYDPDSGRITVDGVDLREFRLDSLRASIASAFQDFNIYADTVAANVLMREPREEDRERVGTALGRVGVDFGDPYSAELTREFDKDGIEPSGGMAQKLAVARVFASDAPIAVLDEPSAALDPVSEAEVFERLRESAVGRTVIFISHRLSSVAKADEVILVGNGRMLERGTHAELMSLHGKYADMYEKQAEAYIKGGDIDD